MSRTRARLLVEQSMRIVLAVLRGEMTSREAARRHGTSAQAIDQSRDRFIEGGTLAWRTDYPVVPGAGRRQSVACEPRPSG
jgi:transposase-like protein